MKEEIKQKIKDILSKELPKDSIILLNQENWLEKIENISKNRNYIEGEAEDIAVETSIMLAGLVDTEEYVYNLEIEIGISHQEALSLASEIFNNILLPIQRKSERKFINENKDKNFQTEQNIGFILTGGNYNYLIANEKERTLSQEEFEEKETTKETQTIALQDFIKNINEIFPTKN
ncbi:hypothetical protein K8Q94_03570 [Candidatus Nomurabacteria bacterium]|nr:hypothetical protein [Candidatus Nomurabacteria bacterium]